MSGREPCSPGNTHQAGAEQQAQPVPVRFAEGPFEGFEGIIVDRRASGRYLIQLHQGVYVETSLVEFERPSDTLAHVSRLEHGTGRL